MSSVLHLWLGGVSLGLKLAPCGSLSNVEPVGTASKSAAGPMARCVLHLQLELLLSLSVSQVAARTIMTAFEQHSR